MVFLYNEALLLRNGSPRQRNSMLRNGSPRRSSSNNNELCSAQRFSKPSLPMSFRGGELAKMVPSLSQGRRQAREVDSDMLCPSTRRRSGVRTGSARRKSYPIERPRDEAQVHRAYLTRVSKFALTLLEQRRVGAKARCQGAVSKVVTLVLEGR